MALESVSVWLIGLVLVLATMLPFVLRQRRKERRTAEAQARARKEGLDKPASLHPVINTDLCIGTGSCLSVCPEQDILGLRSGQAVAVAPANCIGHGLCERSCPVEAIELVFGTEKRGVDIPRIREDFQTNVPGLYIVGELGGMGLIRNAFEQGLQCVEGIARARDSGRIGRKRAAGREGESSTQPEPNRVRERSTGRRATGGGGMVKDGGPTREERANGDGDLLDLVIVGCGPAGLSAALAARRLGFHMAVLEREDIGGTVRHYPRKKIVMTEPVTVPGYGRIGAKEIVKEELILIWEEVVAGSGLEVSTGVSVTDIQPLAEGGFRVAGGGAEYRARRVILAIGRRGIPRKLGIPGEELPNVAYSLREPEAFRGDRITVVGGGDSAVEAGLTLAEQPGNEVRIAYRKDSFSRAKPRNRQRVMEAVDAGRLSVLWSTEVLENGPDRILARGPGDQPMVLPNDRLFVFAGGELPTPFLERCGIQIDTKFGER